MNKINNTLMNPKAILQSDLMGALASGLCVVHCVATPFLFIAQTCSVTGCCETSPGWWSSMDYLFVGITFFAVYHSSARTTKSWVKYALYATWICLTFLIFNEKFALFPIAEWWKYGTAFSLIGLHLYNLKYCQCPEEECCTT